MKFRMLSLLVVPLFVASCAELTHKQTFSADRVSVKTNGLETRLINVEYSIADRAYKQNDPKPEVVVAFGGILKDIIMEVLKEYIPAGQLASATSDVVTVLKKATKISNAVPAPKKEATPSAKPEPKAKTTTVKKNSFKRISAQAIWKPIAEGSRGKSVLVLPKEYRKRIKKCYIGLGTNVDKGVYHPELDNHNGGRAHIYFKKPGKDYPKNSTLVLMLDEGKTEVQDLPNPAIRYGARGMAWPK